MKKDCEIFTLERVSKETYPEAVKTALAKAEEEKTADAYMELGLAFAGAGDYRESVEAYSKAIAIDPFKGILYRHRGHRFLSVYCFENACADLTMASRLIPENWDTWYHLGLSKFLLRDYKGAAEAYEVCYNMSKTDDELIAVSDWYWMTAKRLGDEDLANRILSNIHEGMAYGDNYDYYQRLRMYQGIVKPEDQMAEAMSKGTLSIVTRGFGLANYYNIIGETDKANEIMDMLLEAGKDDMYMAFGYLATVADRKIIQTL